MTTTLDCAALLGLTSNVLPGLARQEQAHGSTTYAKFSSQRSMGNPLAVQAAYLQYALVSQFRALEALANSGALFRHLVLHICSARPEEQVGRITARWVIATVAHLHSFWNRAIRELKRNPIGPGLLATNHCTAVPILVSTAKPRPTRAFVRRLLDAPPKAQPRVSPWTMPRGESRGLSFYLTEFGYGSGGS